MSRTLRPLSPHFGRCRPRLERLERRLALSLSPTTETFGSVAASSVSAFDSSSNPALGPSLSWVSADPANGASVATQPTTVSVTFDRPLDPFSFLGNDILVEERGSNGVWTPINDPFNPPAENLDASGTTLVLTLNQPLTAGSYRLVLPTGSSLAGLDGSMINDPGHNQDVSDFTVIKPGVTLADAVDLGTIGSVVSAIPGTIDLGGDPGAVALYRFEVGPGHHWLFGAQASSGGSGTLASALALFDSQGHPIATANLGAPNSLSDAYLFHGLDAGTYYIGVSGRGNLPGLPGGYDPVTGATGSTTVVQTGGAFHLELVADRADAPARLLGMILDHADPLDPTPTGMTLSFSRLLNGDTVRGNPSLGVVLVNQDGTMFPITAVAFDALKAQYHFFFDRELSPGRYRVEIPATHGATDLAGFTPVARGLPAGVLATFVVKPTAPGPATRIGIGTLYDDLHSGLEFDATVLPGTATTQRFVLETEGLYQFGTSYAGGSLGVDLLGPRLLKSFDPGTPGHSTSTELFLEPGVYLIQFKNLGVTTLHVSWSIKQNTPWDSLLENGVGQGPALSLRLVNPTTADFSSQVAAGFVAASSPAAPDVATANFGPTAPLTSGSGFASIATTAVAPAPSAPSSQGGLFLTLGNAPVGFPSAQVEHVAAVGPGTIALAANSTGLLQGIKYGESLIASSNSSDSPTTIDAAVAVDPTPVNGAMAAKEAAAEPRPDELLIASADWLGGIGAAAANLFSLAPNGDAGASGPTDATAEDTTGTIVLTRDDGPTRESERIAHAQFGGPLVLGVGTAFALRYQSSFRRWFGHKRGTTPPTPFRAGRGPHRRR